MNNRKRIVIIGATSAIAAQCARLWVTQTPAEMILVGRDREKTEMTARDLRVRGPGVAITSLKADFHDPIKIQRLADEVNQTGPVDLVLIAHGSLPDQRQCQNQLGLCRDTLEINGISPALFAEAFLGHMEKADQGVLAIIGSVAGDRGRRSNYTYGAAKGLITRYAQGLQHRFAQTKVKVVLIKPGPTDTPMATRMKERGIPVARVEDVAKCIVNGIAKGKSVIYAPGKWALIMMVVRHVPNFLFKKVNI